MKSRDVSILWFARHEARLAWRDALSMMTAGRKEREKKIYIGIAIFLVIMHAVAYLAVGRQAQSSLVLNLPNLIAISASILLSGSAMLSQAMENVTRTFYSRSDLELILSSPVKAERLFSARIGAMAISVCFMSLLFIGPFVDVIAWKEGPRWLNAYFVVLAVSMVATSLAVSLTIAFFEVIGPKRTRLVAQIAAALVGGLFVIGLQMAAMFSTATASRFTFLRSRYVLEHVPSMTSFVWWPARAALGDTGCLIAVLGASLLLFACTTVIFAPQFSKYVLSASSISNSPRSASKRVQKFSVRRSAASLRRKERLLLLRDPWLISQSLMQLLYLLPPAVLMWRSFSFDGAATLIMVPVLVMASGQLAGGLAWLTISGEDAPDLVFTAPVASSSLLRAKVEAVMQCIAVIFAPFIIGLALISVERAAIAVAGVAASAMSATAIQLWFRSQAKRSQFRRRHTSSRIATFAEAFSSITWAATGAVAVANGWLAMIVGSLALGILGLVRIFSPARSARPA